MSPLSAAAEEKTKPHHDWLPAFNVADLRDPSTLVLLLANLIPLAGVIFGGWDLFTLMMLYWMETGVIGFWHILRMAIVARWFALFLVPFFIVHFGGFMTGHFVFLMAFFGQAWNGRIHGPGDFIHLILIPTNLWVPFLALFISHGVSFYLNFLKSGAWNSPENLVFKKIQDRVWEARTRGRKDPGTPAAEPPAGDAEAIPPAPDRSMPQDLMSAPYKRVMIMHFTIIFGGMLTMVFRAPVAAFVLLVALKTAVDLGSHARKNSKPAPPRGEVPPAVATP